MPYTRYFLVPDYYTKFACKCGDCRSTCCSGWGITVSMEEYFSLLGRDCSPELRRRLDTAFHLAEQRSPEHYAMVTPRFDGHCRLQADDGYCMLQRECGEDAIPAVCRYYPRAPRLFPFPECCTSASCELTLELLFSDSKPVEYVPVELTFKLPEPPESDFPADRYISIRLEAFALLGDRSRRFSERVRRLVYRLFELDGQSASKGSDAEPGVPLVLEFLSDLERTSENLKILMPEVREYYGSHSGSEALGKYVAGLDVKLEKLFVNHLFYKSFPNSFKSAENHLCEEAMALCMAVACTRLIAAARLDSRTEIPAVSETDFVDIVAQIFRVIEHSRFDECAVRFLRQKGMTSPDKLAALAEI